MKIRNITQSPQMVHTLTGTVTIEPGTTVEHEFAPAEAKNIAANVAVFAIGNDADARAPVPSNGQPTAAEIQLQANLDTVTAENGSLKNDVAKFQGKFGDLATLLDVEPSNVFGEVQRLQTGAQTSFEFETKVRAALGLNDGDNVLDAIGDLMAGDKADDGGNPLSLTDAVAKLDDKNDEHWTKTGLPSIEALENLTGGTVTRAQVEGLSPSRTRATA